MFIREKGENCFRDIGNATQFEIVENIAEVQRVSKRCDSFGSALDIVGTKSPTSFNVSFDELDIENLAIALVGNVAPHTQVAATVVDQLINVDKLGCLYDTGNQLISAVTVNAVTAASGAPVVTSVGGTFADAAVVYSNALAVPETITFLFSDATNYTVTGSVTGAMGSGDILTDFTFAPLGFTVLASEWGGAWLAAETVVITVTAAAAGAALVLGTDYNLELQAGFVEVLKGGAVALNDDIMVSYTAADMSADWRCVLGSKKDKVEVEIRLVGTNRADNKRVTVTIPKVSLLPGGGLDFQADDFLVAVMTGTIIQCPNQADAYTVCLEEGTNACEI